MPVKDGRSNLERAFTYGGAMAGVGITMISTKSSHLSILHASVLGAIFGGIGGVLGALLGRVIVRVGRVLGLSAEHEGFGDMNAFPERAIVRLARTSACAAAATAIAAACYVTLIGWRCTAWWMLTIYFMLLAVSLAKFVDYKKLRRKTAASEAWSYVGLAVNSVSLLVIA